MKNYHIILVRHHARANGSIGVRIKTELFKQSIIIPYTNEPGEHISPIKEAIKHLESKGFILIGQGELNNDYILISETFNPLK